LLRKSSIKAAITCRRLKAIKAACMMMCAYVEQPAPASLARMNHAETIDKGHGRIEVRQYRLSTDIDRLRERHPEWNC